jgi:hypothetical protein
MYIYIGSKEEDGAEEKTRASARSLEAEKAETRRVLFLLPTSALWAEMCAAYARKRERERERERARERVNIQEKLRLRLGCAFNSGVGGDRGRWELEEKLQSFCQPGRLLEGHMLIVCVP